MNLKKLIGKTIYNWENAINNNNVPKINTNSNNNNSIKIINNNKDEQTKKENNLCSKTTSKIIDKINKNKEVRRGVMNQIFKQQKLSCILKAIKTIGY